jgi:hypothetical protein
VASEYSVNIRLNTEQVRKDLKDIKSDIDKLGKVNLGTNRRTQRTEAQITKSKDAQRAAMVETRRIGDLVQKAADQGLKVDKARRAINKAALADGRQDFKTAKAQQKVALEELKIQRAITKEKGQQARLSQSIGRQMASPIGGTRTMMGSPAQLSFAGAGMGRSPLQGTRFQFGSPAFFGAGARAGGARSPIAGSRFTFGSPAFNAAQGVGAPRVPIGGRADLVGSPANLLSIGRQNAMPIGGFSFMPDSPKGKKFLADQQAKQQKLDELSLQRKLGQMEERSAKSRKEARLERKRSLSLGKDIVRLKIREVDLDSKALASRVGQGRGESMPLNFFGRGQNAVLMPGKKGSFSREGFGRVLRANRGPALQSAAISGAFPLLFGQGPLAAAGGAIGGGLGGGFGGQMGGFAGGLIGTAVVSGIQNAVAGVAELGKAFNSVTPNIEALTGALGIAGTEEEKRLQLIQKQQGAQAALSQVTQKMNELIGENGVKELKQFGDNARLLGNAFAEAMTKMRAAIAPLLNILAKPFTGQLSKKEQERLAGVGGAATDETLLDLEEELGGIRSTKQNRAKRNRIKARIADRKEELSLFGQSIERANNLRLIENDITRKNRQKNELLQATIDGNKEQVQLSQDIAAEVQKRLDAGFAIMEIDVKDIENQVKKTKELEKQAEIAEQIEQSFKDMVGTIATDLSDGIKGLIRGTSTLNDVFSSVLDKMIDAAFNMAFFGNAGGQLIPKMGLFGNLFGGLLANGGPAKAGKSYIVGERGPELFTPGVSGTVSPNSSLGGSTNIVVNVDASGSSVEGDEQQGRELGRLISVAIQSELVQQKRPGGLLA